MMIDAPHKVRLAEWLPDRIKQRLSGKTVTLRMPRGTRSRLRQKETIAYSEWNEKYRVMGSAESHPGRWRKDIVPHSAWIMDLFSKPWVRELAFCGPDQAAKTTTMIGCIGAGTDMDPGNIFYTASTEAKSKEIVNDKLLSCFTASPKLSKYVSTRADDTGLTKIRLNNGVTIRVAWANSPASTASFSARCTYNDEVDKWQTIGNETNAIRRIQKRAKNYPLTYKHFWSSTPAGKYIYKMCMDSQQVWTHAARCPDCFELIVMDQAHLIIPEGSTEESIRDNPESIVYACNSCGSEWDEDKRLLAFRSGDKFCIKGDPKAKASFVGVHLNSYVTPDMKMATIACTIIAARNGDHEAAIDLAHGIECINYEAEATSTITTEHLLAYRSELPRNLVPSDSWRLVLLVDTQQSSFYYELWSIGYAPEKRLHMIRHGILETFEDQEGLLQMEFKNADQVIHRISNGLIDSGGTRRGYQKHSRTVEVYEWCSRNRQMVPIKGIPRRTGDLITYKEIETYPGTNKKLPRSVKRANLRVDLFKDELERRLALEPDDPGALSFHCDIDEAFAKHYTGETKDEQGDWQHSKKSQRIDYWDCNVYLIAYYEMIKLRIPRKPEDQHQLPEPIKQKPGGFVQGWRR